MELAPWSTGERLDEIHGHQLQGNAWPKEAPAVPGPHSQLRTNWCAGQQLRGLGLRGRHWVRLGLESVGIAPSQERDLVPAREMDPDCVASR